MKIGITGAGPELGEALVGHTLDRVPAFGVVRVKRYPETWEEFSREGMHVRGGDLTAPQTCRRFSGYRATGHRSYRRPPTGVRRRQHTPAIQAAADSEVRHVLYI